MKPSAIVPSVEKIEADLVSLIRAGRLAEVIAPIDTFVRDLGSVVEREARALAGAGKPDEALKIMGQAYELCRKHFTLVIFYMTTLSQRDRKAEAMAVGARARADMPDNVWVWYWSIWCASAAGAVAETDAMVQEAYGLFPAAPEIALAHVQHLKAQNRYSEIMAVARDRRDFQAAYPDLALDLVVGESITSDNLTQAAENWLTFPRKNIKAEARFSIAFRLLSAALKDEACSRILGTTIYDELSELSDVSMELLNDICGRLATLHYTDKAGFQTLRETSLPWLDGLRTETPFSRLLRFAGSDKRVLTDDILGDVKASADANEYVLAYFYLSPEWTRIDHDTNFEKLLEPSPEHPERQFLTQLFDLAYDRGYVPVLAGAEGDGNGRNGLSLKKLLGNKSAETAPRTISVAEDAKAIPTTAAAALARVQKNRDIVRATLSGLKPAPRDRKLKIGVCVSGQLRGYQDAFPTWKKLGLDQHDADIVVHTWADIGRKSPTAQNLDRCFHGELLEQVKTYFLTRTLGEFTRQYPLLTAGLAEAGKATEDELKAFYGAKQVVVEDDSQDPFKGMPNPQKMYYKIKSASGLLDLKAYDLIVRIRPDLAIDDAKIDWHQIQRESLEKGIYFADRGPIVHLEMGVVYADQFAVGVPEVMDIYAMAFDFQAANGGQCYQVSKHYLPHTTLTWSNLYNGITARGPKDFTRGDLLGPGPLPHSTIYELLIEDIRRREPIASDKLFVDACSRDITASLNF